MNAQDALRLARRFIELPLEKRRLFLAGLQQEGVDFSLFPIPADGVSDARDGLSYAQQRMWFLWQLDPQGAAYNLPMAVRLNGELDQAALHSAFDGLVTRHETLRCVFSEQDGQVRQRIVEPFAVNIVCHDLTGLDADKREEQVRALADAEALAPFDLAEGPLLRVQLLKLADHAHVLLLTLHHIVADGWSYNVLIDEFIRLYDAASSGSEAALQPLPIQYRDYALWQRSWLEAGEQDRQLDYWRSKLGDEHAPLELPLDHARPLTPSYRGARHEFQIEPALAERLRGLAREQGVTLFMVLLAAFKVLLHRYSGQQAIRVGVPVANRNRAEVEGLIGCFINTQVLHTEIDPLIDVRELLQRVKETALGAQAHQELPFERLVEAFEPQRSLGRNPLFQVLFNHQPTVVDAGQITTRSGLALEKVTLDKHSARFDLSLDTYESAGRLQAVFTYALDVFEASTVATLQQHWLQLLEGLTANPGHAVGELPLSLPELSPATEQTNGAGVCIHQLIEQAANANPQRVAAISGEQQIDYLTLTERANAFAHVLLESGVQPDQRVGVIADRSIDMLVGILAVLKAGAAYLPLEPDQPHGRLDFMLADSDVRLVLARADWNGTLPEGVQRIHLDAALRRSDAPAVAVAADNLAYVIYTSGTTGTPKGVAISHAALVNYVQGVSRRLPLDDIQNLAMVTTPAADLGHTVFYGALSAGKTLHMLDKPAVLDADAFAAYMHQHAIDALKIVPSHLQAMLAAGATALPRRCLIVGGESCPAGLLAHIAQLAPELRVINHYGPTETTVGVLTHDMAGQPVLGRPLDNIRAQVLSDCLLAVPGLARGELFIAGAGLARGYLGQAALTAERFVPDPASAKGSRMYRTGDWVRRNARGELVFAGRMDGQVKIRGYRVELAEIESRLRQLPAIGNAVVRVIGEDAGGQLAAWVVPATPVSGDAAQQAFVDAIRGELKQALPEHMQPTHMQVLAQLPVTANGKVDVKALPSPVANVASHVAPMTALQIQLADIWAQVLQVERVGLTDNFFALGGHSLLATQVVSRARRQLDVDIPLRALFDTHDLHAFALSVQRLGHAKDPDIQLLDRSAPLAVSHAQHRQWLFWKLNPQSAAYNTPLAVKLQGALDWQALQAAFDALLARHESLRTIFEEQDGQPLQRILPAAPVVIHAEDLSGQGADAVTRRIEEHVACVFDLSVGPLIRVTVFKTADEEHLLTLLMHHIVSDGWSMSVMVRELAASYNARASGQALSRPALPVQYADYAAWQRQRLADGQLQTQLAFWKAQLEDDFSVLQLPADHPRPQEQSYRGGRIDIHLPAQLTDKLRALAVGANATLFHVFLSSFAILLSRYSGSEKINIGIPVTNRNRHELEGLIGFFVNTIVARVAVDPLQTFDALLASVKETTLEAQANKDVPFDALVEALKPERTLGYNPLFQVMYNHLRDVGDQVSSDSLQGLHAQEVDLSESNAQFDLVLDTMERTDGLMASFNYACDLFTAERIERLAGHWVNLLEALVQAPAQTVFELPLLDRKQYRQITHDWAHAQQRYPNDQFVHHLIEDQARKAPEAIALVSDEQTLSYQTLNRRANRLAHKLQELGVGPDTRVGIAVERGPDMVVSVLAVFKAGGAYVPLDIEYPQERLAYMLQDSGAGLLLTQAHLLERLPVAEAVQTLIVEPSAHWLEDYSEVNLVIDEHPQRLAYVIYTSGSTGLPKGVTVAHGALAMHCLAAAETYAINAHDCLLQFASVSFDAAAEQIFMPLAQGARVVLGDFARGSLEQLAAQIRRQGVSVLDLPPGYASQLRESITQEEALSVRVCILGGEAWDVRLADGAGGLQARQWFNAYGPTEAVVSPLIWPVDQAHAGTSGRAPIGRPVGERRVYVLGDALEVVAPDSHGELFIGGQGLARGYHARPALTAERFIPDPFDEQGGGRLYRSGDLARYFDDGVIEYAGRVDHQVKIRGFRIELGEIEARLQEQAAVRDAVVLAHEGPNGPQLVAYVVPARTVEGAESSALRETLRGALKSSLPDYMVPAHLMFLDLLPLTPNGKLDRKALPAPEGHVQPHYLAPQSTLEQQIAGLWQDVLKLERVGLTDNFFELGGDSIISLQVVSRARQAGIQFTPKDLFQHQTVQALALVARRAEGRVIDQDPVTGSSPLTPIQQWFFAESIPERQHWNQSVLLAPIQALDAAHLHGALHVLVQHHDALRLRFEQQPDAWQADYQGSASDSVLWTRQVADVQALQALGNEAQRSLNLAQGPLLRAVLAELADGSQRLLLVVHHLVVDGVSWRVLLEDLQQAYRAQVEGQKVALPAKTSSFKAWATHLQDYAVSPVCEAELGYWHEQLKGSSDALPCDHPQGGRQRKHAAYAKTRLDRELTTQLLQQAPAAYRTQINDLLLTALARVVCRWSGQAQALIRLEGHGREDLFDDLDLTRTVGWFTSMYPVMLSPQPELGASIKQIKEQLRAIPNKGIGYGLLRYLGNAEARQRLSQLAQGEIVFNYLGQFDGGFDDDTSLFVPAREHGGLEQSPEAPLDSLLSLNGQVYDGELSLDWTYSREVFDAQTIEHLAQAYADELKALIAHCCDPRHRGVTPSDFPLAALTQAQLDSLPMAAEQIADLYPLSPMQQGMLFHSLYEQEAGDYINQMRVDVQGLDAEIFRQVWQDALDAHDILRTGFVWQGLEQPVQVVYRQVELSFTEFDWRNRVEQSVALDNLAGAELKRSFALEQAPLLHLTLVRTGENTHHLIYTNHHILMDGWSNSQLMGEVLQRYTGQALVQAPGKYRDYIAWLQRQDMQLSEVFWKTQLKDLEEPTRLAQAIRTTGHSGVQDSHGEFSCRLDKAQTQRLSHFARQQKVTVNTLVQAAWLLLLQRYTGQATVAFGATVSGRPAQLQGVEQQVGLFINTLPVIATPQPEQPLHAWLQQVQRQNLTLREYEHTPLFDVQRWAGRSGEDLFDSLLVFENYPISQALEQGAPQGLVFGPVGTHEQTNYALTLLIGLGDELCFNYSYAQARFDDSAMARLAGQLKQLLVSFAQDAELPVGELSLLSEAERSLILCDWNRTDVAYPGEQCIHTLIEASVAQTPEAIAVIFGDRQLTYGELNRQANRLGHYLIESGVGPDVLVGIAVERSIEMVVGLLGILKAGGAYVPLDPEYPQDRLAHMFQDSGIELLLTQEHLRGQLQVPQGIEVVSLDRLAEKLATCGDANPVNETQLSNLAYVIYTSGSTGKPKGAGNTHQALFNRLAWMQKAYGLNGLDAILQKTPFSFDVSVWEFFWPLQTGARLVVAQPGEHRDPERLIETIKRHEITTLHFVPSMLQVFMGCEGVQECQSIRRIVCSGEALPGELARKSLQRLPSSGVFNLYGPTEAAIDVTHWTCTPHEGAGVPIGRPIDNLKTHILVPGLLPAAQGCVGELYLGGVGLARGYHRRPSLTAERFVPDPFDSSEQGGGRLYRSGDLASYRADGVIDYLGRTDHQVKIRGLRIEMGEIAARLQEHDAVREAVVLDVKAGSGKQLAAYLVSAASVSDSPSEGRLRASLQNHLKATLPEYMVPSHFVFLDALPLSPNGKLDRKALPAPDARLQQDYVSPQSEVEQHIAAIWSDVLKLEQIGLNDNFFELGGDSIISIQVVSRARQIGISFTPKEMFQHQTVKHLAAVARRSQGLSIDQGLVSGLMPLTPVQHGFFAQEMPNRHHWNQSVLLKPHEALDSELLGTALHILIEHHDALRLRFEQAQNGWQARFEEVKPSEVLWVRQIEHAEEFASLADHAQRSLCLERGTLFRAVLAQLPDRSQRFLLVVHHLVVDGVSWRILLEDLQHVYQALSADLPVRLPGKSSAFKAWAEHLQAYAESPGLLDELAYWQAQLQEGVDELPCDRPKGGRQYKHAAYASSRLDQIWTRRLLQEAPAAYRTQVNDLLLTALARVIGRWTGQPDVLVRLEGHGREDLFDDLDLTRTVGWFTSVYPVKLSPQAQMSASIKAIKEQLRGIPDKGVGYGVLRHLGNAEAQAVLGHLPQGELVFNYLGQFDGSFDEAGSLFIPARESSGTTQDRDAPLAALLTVNGQVYEGELNLDWTFSREVFDEKTIGQLAQAYTEELKLLIDHCCNTAQRGATPSDFPLARLSQAQLDHLPVELGRVADLYPLSPMQQGMLFHSLFEQDAAGYVNQMRVDVDGLDIERFKQAWRETLAAHETLRSGFIWQGQLESPLQVVHQDVTLPFVEHDWRGRPKLEQALQQLAEGERLQGFDMDRPPLLRLTVVATDEARHHLIYTSHHILMDGWSNSRLLGEVLQRYAEQPVPSSSGRYRDYIEWLQRQDLMACERFWKEQLTELAAPTRLVHAIRLEGEAATGYGDYQQLFDPVQTRRFEAFARANRVTVNTLVQSAWLLLLQGYTGQDSVCFGATVAGRPTELVGIEEQIGLFINTLTVIGCPRPEQSVTEWIGQVQARNLALREFEHTALYEVQRWAGLGGEALFDSLLVFENYPVSEALRQGAPAGLHFGPVAGQEQTNYPLTLGVGLGETLTVQYSYDRRHFDLQAVARLAGHFGTLLKSICEQPTQRVCELSMLDRPEHAAILARWDQTGQDHP
ncbi:non-ribosomal peptide synthase/polyketide synthase, partial [Pseudomonas ovata]|uniref:non-ribosomal peptide synthase/polyketide synthase n=1 Tax=Pseudomonas ovata TaxID=1839709 RepID=UPI000D6908FF